MVCPNVVQGSGQLSLPHVAMSKTERNIATNIKPMSSSCNNPWIKHKLVVSIYSNTETSLAMSTLAKWCRVVQSGDVRSRVFSPHGHVMWREMLTEFIASGLMMTRPTRAESFSTTNDQPTVCVSTRVRCINFHLRVTHLRFRYTYSPATSRLCVCDSTFLFRDLEVFGFTSR